MKKTTILFILSVIISLPSVFGQPEGWDYVKKLVIDTTVVQGTLSNFPVTVILTADNFDFSQAKNDGSDIRFTDLSNNPLTFEREIHDAVNETAVYWVKTSGDMLMYYGNSAAIDAANTTGGVWESNYRAVWHMKDFEEDDELINDNTQGTNYANKLSVGQPEEVTAKVGSGQRFDGMNDLLTVFHSTGPTGINISAAVTVSALVKPAASSPVLDQVEDAVAAFSLRKLNSGYSGYAIRVRRSSNNDEEDIGFDVNGMLDLTALLDHVGSGDGYVVTWYDQSGNGKNVTQSTSSSQPMIVESGSVLMSDNKPMLRFNNDYLDGTVNMGGQYADASLNAIWRQTSDGKSEIPVFLGTASDKAGLNLGYYYNSYVLPFPPFQTVYTRWNYISLWYWQGYNYIDGFSSNLKIQTATYYNNGTSSEMRVFLNGSPSSYLTSDANALNLGSGYNSTPFRIGANQDGSDYLSGTYVAEIVLFNKVLSSNERELLEKNQSNCYGFSSPVIAGKGRSAYQLELCNENYIAYINGDTIMAPASMGDYQHVVMTYNQTDFNLYVDGVLQRTKSKSGTIATNTNNLFIGQQYTGIIDEVRISGSARSAEWISNDYNSVFNTLLIFDESGFDIEDPGQQVAGVPFEIDLSNARDFFAEALDGNISVTVTSNNTGEGAGADGVLFDEEVTFTSGAATIEGLILKTAETHTLTITVAGVTSAEKIDVQVVAAAPDAIVFVTPERTVISGEVSDTITVQLLDVFGNVAVSSGATAIDLSSDNDGTFRDLADENNITQVIIGNEESRGSFRYTSGIAGIHLLSVSDPDEVLEGDSQNITVNPKAASKMVIISPQREIVAGDTSGIITVQLQDEFDNPSIRTVNTVIGLESDNTGSFRDSSNLADIEEIIILAGNMEMSFRYTSVTAGVHLISVNDTVTIDPITGDSQELTVLPAPAAKISFSTPERTFSAGDTSDIITLRLLDEYDNPTVSTGEITIILESDFAGTFIDLNDVEIDEENPLIIGDEESEISFRYTSDIAGIHTLTANDAAEVLEGDSQEMTVTSIGPAKIVFITPQRTIAAGDASDTITVQLLDKFDNIANSSGETTIALSSDKAGAFRNLDDDEDIEEIVISDGESEAGFRYTSTLAGVHLLSADDPEEILEGDSQELTVNAAAPVKIIFITEPDTINAGETSEIITIRLLDGYDNTAVSSGTTTVNLSSSMTGSFRNVANTITITSINITSGNSQASFRYTSDVAGSHILSVTDAAAVLIGDDQELVVLGHPAYQIAFITPVRTIYVGDTSDIITVQLQDEYGNRTVHDQEVMVILYSDYGAVFVDDADEEIIYVTIAQGDSEASFRVTSEVVGEEILTAEDNDAYLIPAYQFFYVETPPPPTFTWVGGVSGNETNWHTGGNWSTGTVPGSTDAIRIPSTDYDPAITAANVTVADLIIENGAHLTITNSRRLTIRAGGNLTIRPGGKLTSTFSLLNSSGGASGLIIESDESSTGSLIHTNANVPAIVQRHITGSKWHIVSVPITGLNRQGQTIQSFLATGAVSYSPANQYYAMTHYNENPDGWSSYYTTSTSGYLLNGQGYLVRRENNGILPFTGNLPVGTVNIPVNRNDKGWNAIGNPFPSAIGVTENAGTSQNFLEENVAIFDSSYAGLYVWDEPTPRVSGVSYYKIINNAEPSGRFISPAYLQPGQGFILKAIDNDERVAVFTPQMRAHENSVTFFKKSTREPWSTINLVAKTSSREASTLITFNERMTKGLDITYDAGLLGGDPALRLYTRLIYDNGVNFAIQCLPDYETEKMIVPVGISIPPGGMVTFTSEINFLPPGYKAILEDRDLGIFTDLKTNEAGYSVVLPSYTSGTGRFFLHLVTGTTDINPVDNQKINIFAYGKDIYIQGMVQEASNALIFDLTGRLMKMTRLEPDPANLNVIRVDELKSGIYIVRIEGKGRVETGKVFVE